MDGIDEILVFKVNDAQNELFEDLMLKVLIREWSNSCWNRIQVFVDMG